MDVHSLWQAIVERAQTELSSDHFQRWLAPCVPKGLSDTTLVIEVPSIFVRNWITEHYRYLIEKWLAESAERPLWLDIVINPALSAAGIGSTAGGPSRSLSVEDDGLVLNPRYTFDNFIEGSSNRFARAACVAVAQAPARAYNPLFIYGGTGLGKTHLMQAIGHHVGRHHKRVRVCYTSSEHFTNHLIASLQKRAMDKFRRRYRTMNALLIDDIHFLCGKEQTQEEFFHTFNTLFDHSSQIVVTSDRAPSELNHMEERLISRFQWGLVVDLQLPDLETRVAILRNNAELSHVTLPDEVTFFLAERIRSNIRQLQGSFLRVLSYASLIKVPISISLCEKVLEDVLTWEAEHTLTLDEIQRRVAEHFDLRVADMKSNRRPRSVALPRQIAMYLARELTTSSLVEIGEAFGGRDHSTVVHGHKAITKRLGHDPKVRLAVSALTRKLQKM